MPTVNDLIFKLEHQFTLYLQRCGITRAELSPDALREIRRAFYGGCGQMFFIMSQDVIELPNKKIPEVLINIQDQLQAFWDREVKQQSEGITEYVPQMPVRCGLCDWKGTVADLVKPEPDSLDNRCMCPTCQNKDLEVRRG